MKRISWILCLILVISMPFKMYAADYPGGNTYSACRVERAYGTSNNGFTQATLVWEYEEMVYLAVASRDNPNEIDEEFKERVAGAYPYVDFITQDSVLTVIGQEGEVLYSSSASAATGKNSNIWCVLGMSRETFQLSRIAEGEYEFPVISAGGFALRVIFIDGSFEDAWHDPASEEPEVPEKPIEPTEPSEPELPQEPIEPPVPEEPEVPEEPTGPEVPNTGDVSRILMWGAIWMMSMTALIYLRKQKT